MDRPRHTDLISRIQAKGANVSLIGDGDIAAALDSADPDLSTDLLMSIGATPEESSQQLPFAAWIFEDGGNN